MKNKKIGKGQVTRTAKRRLGKLKVEGRWHADETMPAKERPHWYCDERKVASMPFKWHKFEPGCGLITAGSVALVATKQGIGKVLMIPWGSTYEQTARLFREHWVAWFAHMPGVPTRDWKQTQVLGPWAFNNGARWELPERKLAELDFATVDCRNALTGAGLN